MNRLRSWAIAVPKGWWILLVLVILLTVLCFWVFRGKASDEKSEPDSTTSTTRVESTKVVSTKVEPTENAQNKDLSDASKDTLETAKSTLKAVEKLTDAVNKLTEAKSNAPAVTTLPAPPALQPAVSAPLVSQPISPVPLVPISNLVQDMGSNDIRTAKEAAYRLIRRQDTVSALVEAYSSNDKTMKARALWCLKNMGETTRNWLNQVLSNPDQYRPSLVSAAQNIADELGGNFSPPESNATKKATENEEVLAKINELKANLVSKEAEYSQLLTELKKQAKELSATTVKLETNAKMALRTHNRQDAIYVVQLKAYVEELKENISKLSGKIALLEEEIRRLRAMSYQPRAMSCPP